MAMNYRNYVASEGGIGGSIAPITASTISFAIREFDVRKVSKKL